MIAADGYRQPYIKTGYEYIIPNRTTDKFACNAKQDGKVISVNDKGIIFEYADGQRYGVELGKIFSKCEDSTYPYTIVSRLKTGDIFKKGDNIAYNTSFFEEDMLDPSKIITKSAIMVKTALFESNQTFEDSSSISKRVGIALNATNTYVRSIVLDFDQNIHQLVKVGQKVDYKDKLLLIEDVITSKGQFSQASLDTLQKLATQSPSCKYRGVIEKVEMYYNGELEDMSESLRAVATTSNKNLKTIADSTNNIALTGRVTSDYSIDGVPLTPKKCEIRIYLTTNTLANTGDKGIFASQLKSVFGEVMDYDMHTKSGERVDAVFGMRSISARICLSPTIMGTTTSLLKVIAKQAIGIYKGKS